MPPASKLKRRRQQQRLRQEHLRTQMELENVYVSRARFSRIETGESLPNAAEIIALVNVLQVSYGWLLAPAEEARA